MCYVVVLLNTNLCCGECGSGGLGSGIFCVVCGCKMFMFVFMAILWSKKNLNSCRLCEDHQRTVQDVCAARRRM